MRIIVIFIFVVFSTGCSHVMSEESRKQVDASISYQVIAAKPDSNVGKTIMVGGILAGIRGSRDVTTYEIAQLELLSNGVPDETSASGGRFLAVSTELSEPLVHPTGSLVTLVGIVKGKKIEQRDGADYPYPLLTVKEMKFFRPSRDLPDLHPNPYQPVVGDERFILSPPGLPGGEPHKLP